MNDAHDDPILAALRARGSAVRRIRYRENRTVLLSVSRDGRTLNSHACFQDAPADVVAAIIAVVTGSRDTARRREALRQLREWEGTRRGLARARRSKPRRESRVNGSETAPVRALFQLFNRDRFGGGLPEIPLRLSRRMTRALGTIRYGGGGTSRSVGTADRTGGTGSEAERRGPGSSLGRNGVRTDAGRTVVEIAISAELLRPANRPALEDTLLHEMAHAEAWLEHGHRGHGPSWRRIATRVGCRPRAVNDIRVSRRGG